jgi:Recombination endonuclease VII
MELTEQQKAKDKRLQKEYRWTLEMYNELDRIQHHQCAICNRLFKTGGNLDHEHFKIETSRMSPTSKTGWLASTTFKDGRRFFLQRKTKKDAIDALRDVALPASVRGLLCPGRHGSAGHGCCNRLLGRVDDISWLQQSINYLKDPPAKKLQFAQLSKH